MPRIDWTRDQLLVAFNYYFRTPFGRLHKSNPDIVAMAKALGRTPSAVAMKLCNFASLDPVHQKRNVKGLSGASAGDRVIWDEYHANWEALAFESQQALDRLGISRLTVDEEPNEPALPTGPTEAARTVRARLVQRFFHDAVMANYERVCSMCRLSVTDLLIASHIIPWRASVERRADPSNGISLCALHDKAFDRGYLSIDEAYRVLVSPRLKTKAAVKVHAVALIEIESAPIQLPRRFAPAQDALSHHRNTIFR